MNGKMLALGIAAAVLSADACTGHVVRPDEPVTVKSTWLHRGVAWLHRGASLTWSLLDEKGTVCWSSTDAKFDFRTLDPTLNGVEKPQTVESRCFFGHDEPDLSARADRGPITAFPVTRDDG